MESKDTLRKKYKALRKSLSESDIKKESERIKGHFFSFLDSKSQTCHIHTFLPIERLNEVDTLCFLDGIWERGHVIYTGLLDSEKKEMKTLRLVKGSKFEAGEYGIPVPKKTEIADWRKIDLVLIPLLAWDQSGNRIGYGKGYYDKFLANLSEGVERIGLSFFPPEENLPSEPHDVKLTHVITGEGLTNIR
ncbi:5-formyltetrahydrofolate cyclo-ligase [Algoriphagus sp. C2-7]|uniref:5-formyltetrahydrofolate cyclo-ligase n=2 Tax=Algoriphagus sediminis TaxID=3057113 RepID=A0ABT7YES2_9BACT|nr:5-formyltetrahydrofolate cyclo-ligase [Algoriphagus sediminis]